MFRFGAYFFAATRWLPQLWPAGNAPLQLTILLFAIVVLGFGGHSLMLNTYVPERQAVSTA